MATMPKKKDETPAGAPEWMTTFSDMMSLLLCFFVLLFALSTIEEKKFMQTIGLIRGAFGRIPNLFNMSFIEPTTVEPQQSEPTMDKRIIERVMDAIAEKAREKLVAVEPTHNVQIRGVEEGIRFEIQGELLFRPGSAEIPSVSAVTVLDPILGVLSEFPNRIRIEGHTDDVWSEGVSHFYKDNFDLAAARAYNVLKYMETHPDPNLRIQHDRLSLESFGPNHPRAPNDTPLGRQLNRRVSIVLLEAFQSETMQGELNSPENPQRQVPIEEVMPLLR